MARAASLRDRPREARRIFHETLTRRQFMTERSCAQFGWKRRRRMKSKRHGRFCFHISQNHEHTRRFAGFDLGHHKRFVRQDRARAPGHAHLRDMLPKQPDENPSAETAHQCERGQQQRQHPRPGIRQNSTLPRDEFPDGEAQGRGGGRSTNWRDAIFLNPRLAAVRSVDCSDAAKPGPIKILQYSPTGPRALENANHQNAIAILPPKPHTQPYRI
jgi:hypothetical protein